MTQTPLCNTSLSFDYKIRTRTKVILIEKIIYKNEQSKKCTHKVLMLIQISSRQDRTHTYLL